MKLGLAPLGSMMSLFVLLTACSSGSTTVVQGSPDGGSKSPDSTDPNVDPDDPANQPPHALGSITLGESHASGSGGTSTPIVSAVFVPDAAGTRTCATKLDDACQIVALPKCTKSKTTSGCEAGEACVLDEDCTTVCKKVAVCSKECDEDESCTLDDAGEAVCAKIETFDAGPLAFSGTTSSITMFPPYAYEGNIDGAPFLAGAEIKVQAQGAVDAGFEAFEETFTATTFLQTSPALSKISRDKVFGTEALPIGWKPGNDTIRITVAGPGGSVICTAKDADGSYDLPRTAIDAALGDRSEETVGVPYVSLSIARQRKDTKKGLKTKGELTNATVQSEGWLELVTLSTESTSFQGCSGTLTACGTNECADLQSDSDNCGSCGNACSSGKVCGGGQCISPAQACDACTSAAVSGTCKTPSSACNADTACKAIVTCASSCTTQTCVNTCFTQNPTGQAKFNAFQSCLSNACYSVCQ